MPSLSISPEQALRRQIASRYLCGSGIEIGALHSPLEVPDNATVHYVDRMMVAELRKQYPELAEYDLVEVDIIDDGETLLSVTDSSVDFVIANHMIEHCQNPIGTIEQHLRVLRPGGILYLAVPDKRYTFDCERPVTSLEHLIRDYTEGPEWSRISHFEEWARLVDKVSEDEVTLRVQFLAEINYSIHFHVWTQLEFLELLLYCRDKLSFPIEVELLQKNGIEFIVVISKTAELKNAFESFSSLELERLQAQLRQTQTEKERLPSQLKQTQPELEQLQFQLQHTQVKLQQAQAMINAMQTSKFWKLRNAWFKLKKSIKLGTYGE